MVFWMSFEVGDQIVNVGGKDGYLNFRGPGILFGRSKILNDLTFLFS